MGNNQSSTETAIQILLEDAERYGGALPIEAVNRVLEKRNLDDAQILVVLSRLAESGVLEQSGSAGDATSDEADEQNATDELDADSEENEPTNEQLASVLDKAIERELLTAQEEIELSRAISIGAKLEGAASRGEVLDSTALEAIARGKEAWDRMIESNIRLTIKEALYYASRGDLLLDDLIQEGVIGLMRAVQKFDPSKGFRFSTYATWWIRQSITRCIANTGATIRLPVHRQLAVSRMRRAHSALSRFLERTPTLHELADELEMKLADVQFLLDLSRQRVLDIQKPINSEGSDRLIDLIRGDYATPEEIIADLDAREAINRVLLTLTPRERDIICKRFGLDYTAERTLEEIGQDYNVTRERVRQVEAKALRKLRHPSRRGTLESLIEVTPRSETEEADSDQ